MLCITIMIIMLKTLIQLTTSLPIILENAFRSISLSTFPVMAEENKFPKSKSSKVSVVYF